MFAIVYFPSAALIFANRAFVIVNVHEIASVLCRIPDCVRNLVSILLRASTHDKVVGVLRRFHFLLPKGIRVVFVDGVCNFVVVEFALRTLPHRKFAVDVFSLWRVAFPWLLHPQLDHVVYPAVLFGCDCIQCEKLSIGNDLAINRQLVHRAFDDSYPRRRRDARPVRRNLKV